MSQKNPRDPTFEIGFFESVLRRQPDYAMTVEILGGLYTRHGRIADGLKMDRRLVRPQPQNPTAHYNLACSLALSKRPPAAIKALQTAVSFGYDDLEWLQQDPDLEAIRQHPKFLSLIQQLTPQS